MARGEFPQIPRQVWWQVRRVLQKTPTIRLDERNLAVELQVQSTAARQYLAELKRVGILTEEGRPTDLARRWRMDESYRGAAADILKQCYPQSLVEIAPANSADRGKVESWFMTHGFGSGTAKNKAATYVMIANDDPPSPEEVKTASPRRSSRTKRRVPPDKPQGKEPAPPPAQSPRPDVLPLNVNLQIHISADASSQQIEAIFMAMRKYLHDHGRHREN